MDELGWIVVLIGLMGAIGKLVDKGRKRLASEGQSLKMGRMFQEVKSNLGQSGELNPGYDQSQLTTENEESHRPYEREEYEPYAKEVNFPYERESLTAYQRQEREPFQRNQHKKANPFRHLTREQLREGIILAEVLSEKPRAKNPHSAIARYHHRPKG
ncbi:MAG TPA: hypothetical protein VFT51_08520 [Bacillales bacterium]|nr:hypothetical protein [Bacillales bacterium]